MDKDQAKQLFKPKLTGEPYGDACSRYGFELKEPRTLGQLMEYVNAQDEWGKVYVGNKNIHSERLREPLATFEYGRGIGKLYIPPFFQHLCIIKLTAHGGWVGMDYYAQIVK